MELYKNKQTGVVIEMTNFLAKHLPMNEWEFFKETESEGSGVVEVPKAKATNPKAKANKQANGLDSEISEEQIAEQGVADLSNVEL